MGESKYIIILADESDTSDVPTISYEWQARHDTLVLSAMKILLFLPLSLYLFHEQQLDRNWRENIKKLRYNLYPCYATELEKILVDINHSCK